MECWDDGIMGSKSGKSHINGFSSSLPARASQWQAGRFIIPVLHYADIPIGAKPLSS